MHDIFLNLKKARPRILLVENDPVARISYQALLVEWGYDPVLAMGMGAALQKDAREKAFEKRCALALIDLRLVDDDDEEDTSGLILAEELKGKLHPIILSGHENQQILRDMLQYHKDIPFIAKHDRRDDFQKMLDAESEKITASKRNITFENAGILEEIASTFGDRISEYPDQLADIFAQLFPTAILLRLEKITEEKIAKTIETKTSFSIKVFEEDALQPVLVKLGLAENIQQEVNNYNRYLKDILLGKDNVLLAHKVLWDIGVIIYSYSPNKDLNIRKY